MRLGLGAEVALARGAPSQANPKRSASTDPLADTHRDAAHRWHVPAEAEGKNLQHVPIHAVPVRQLPRSEAPSRQRTTNKRSRRPDHHRVIGPLTCVFS